MGLAGGIVADILTNVERKVLLNSFHAVDARNEKDEVICPLRLVDGGPWNHTGIVSQGYAARRALGRPCGHHPLLA